MADNFTNILVPVSSLERLEVIIDYRFVCSSKGKSEKTNVKVQFDFMVEEKNPATAEYSVAEFFKELDLTILNRLSPLLGKNVQLLGLSLKTPTFKVSLPLYRFGTNAKPVTTANNNLFFSLQPFGMEKDFRFYLKGTSPSFSKTPLADEELMKIRDFESLFTSSLSLFNGTLVLQYIKNNHKIISCIYRETVQFQRRQPKKMIAKKVVKKRRKSRNLEVRSFQPALSLS